MRQRWETMTSVSAGHIILIPTQPIGSGRPQRESNPGPPHQESRGRIRLINKTTRKASDFILLISLYLILRHLCIIRLFNCQTIYLSFHIFVLIFTYLHDRSSYLKFEKPILITRVHKLLSLLHFCSHLVIEEKFERNP